MAKPGRPGAAKRSKGGKVGTGGNGRQALEGKGPTPRAEDRKGHPAQKAAERKAKYKEQAPRMRKGEFLAPTARTAGAADRHLVLHVPRHLVRGGRVSP